ncbi:MAG: LPS export ABC transporter periplasmic protein LptC [Deltaproteobacteria bacterium]|nr:LPS export ABC transporter periplasmic protein LptC [Deltaproteobacteria bacterium]
MRRRLQILVLTSVVVLLGAVGFLVGRTLWQQHRRSLPLLLDIVPGVSQHIQNFKRVKVKDGRTVWEVAADDAQYFDERKTVEVRGIVLRWYLQDGRVVGLKGDTGKILLDGHDVQRIDLDGDIVVSLADYEVKLVSATYDESRDVITSPGPVEISGTALALKGSGMQVELRRQQLSLINGVTMQLQPSRLPRGGEHGPF